MSNKPTVLLVDDDVAMGKVLTALLRQADLDPKHVPSGQDALSLLERRPFDLVLTDLQMPGMDGMALLSEIKKAWQEMPVIVLTAHGSVPLAVEAMRHGAADFLLKPFDREELVFVIRKALAGAARDNTSAPASPAGEAVFGESAAMKEVESLVRRAAPGTATVLLLGESGTGKELVARRIHEASPRSDKPFVKLNCGALPDALLESELFGYEKGAFTGAATRKPGRIELAHQGTLLLDEIGDVTPQLQVRLLRVLQEKEVERLGGTSPTKVDVRFIAATHRNLPEMVTKGEFREDLFYRLNVVPIQLPPLRARPADIEPLARRFTLEHARANGKSIDIGADAIALLALEAWPGNVRQLQNFIERLVVLSDGPTIRASDVSRELARLAPASPSPKLEGAALDSARKNAETEAVKTALSRAGGNRTVAARILGLSRRGLYYKLDELGLA
jgi:two-component system, NtrC family, response regulator AtoC